MKKMIAVLSLVGAFALVGAASAKLSIVNNSTDDGFHGINSTVFAKLKINVDQKAQVYNEVNTYGSSGSNTIVCGEDCDGTVDSGDVENTTEVGLDVNSSEITYEGLTGGSDEVEIANNSSDDGFFGVNTASDTDEKVDVKSNQDLAMVANAATETGANTGVAGDDGTFVLKSGKSMNNFTQIVAAGYAKITRQ